ncbi:MAG TPA: DUF308 domain-containing protein [Acidobacteriaceae bacterium]|nr:DUF308 domain-containing protein [Acidobacteriaceae bacterium]
MQNHTSRFAAAVMIATGAAAIALPFFAGIGLSIAVGILMIVTGIAYESVAISTRGTGVMLWRLLVGIAFLASGLYLVIHPALGLLSLTLALAILFAIEGAGELAAYFSVRSFRGSTWLLLNALVTLWLGFMIWRGWPISSTWAAGTILGVDLITSGAAFLTFSPVNRFAPAV